MISKDLEIKRGPEGLSKLAPDPVDYYTLPLSWFETPLKGVEFAPVFKWYSRKVPDFLTYFRCLCELHKRRKKFTRILQTQQFASLDQISPRGLLEFGLLPERALASWLVWRKWLFDIDNRSAQETGYLFEPILAAALGGISYSSKASPVRRRGDNNKGRQVDCIVDNRAYEFKLRVTIAASGQGRFAEELEFASDASESGFMPILLVLDPTPSGRLEVLSEQFEEHGGRAFIGDDAWTHLEEEAGKTMGVFVEHYVRRPILEAEHAEVVLRELRLELAPDQSSISIAVHGKYGKDTWSIARTSPPVGGNSNDDDDC